jgi:5-methylcytosine-specific restriction enzyme subunit McrC
VTLVTVREHARLTTGPVAAGSLDEASISVSAFDWLCREAQRHRTGGAALVQIEDRRWLRLDNYVGVLESPCGTRIEILPKHVRGETDKATARKVLVRMLRHGLRLPVRDTGPTALQTFNAPISEWIIQQFLHELDVLVRRGLRFDYHPVEEEVRFLRGRLQIAKQIRQPAGRRHLFQVEHQVFDANRAENRLIASALDKVAGMTHDPANWRLAHELEHQIVEIRRSSDVVSDFRRWSSDRLMSHYGRIRPWCELILGNRSPMSALGEWTGRSLLFPMEKVFECFVEACLRRLIPPGAVLRTQAARHHLCKQGNRPMFQLRPDFVIEHEGASWVVDAKWKLLDASDVANHYGLRQGDFYQLFAYGKRYLAGSGRLTLIYPKSERFSTPLDTFDMQDGLWLDAIPLDLESGLPVGGVLPSLPVTRVQRNA